MSDQAIQLSARIAALEAENAELCDALESLEAVMRSQSRITARILELASQRPSIPTEATPMEKLKPSSQPSPPGGAR